MELLYLSGNILPIKPEKNYFSGIIYKMLKKMLNKTQIGIRPAEKYLDTSKKIKKTFSQESLPEKRSSFLSLNQTKNLNLFLIYTAQQALADARNALLLLPRILQRVSLLSPGMA